MSESSKSDFFFKNRRKTREALLCALYAYEMNEVTIGQLKNDPESFFLMLEESRESSWVDALKDQLETIFFDVRQHKLEADDLISLDIPQNGSSVTLKFSDLESNYWRDGFTEFCRSAEQIHGVNDTEILPEKELDPVVITSNREFFNRSLELYSQNGDKFDLLIKDKLKNWDYTRIAIMDKVVIRMGIIELLNYKDIPPLVTVNEAIELGKKYSTDNSGKFINGLLHAFLTELDNKPA